MKYIELTQNKKAMVDDSDYEFLSQFKWHVTAQGYAARRVWVRGGNSDDSYTIRMHREIMDAPKGLVVDHINHIKLDNQRDNLRVCTQLDNNKNTSIRSNNSSGYKGVNLHDKKRYYGKPWRAVITANGKRRHLGFFATPEEAAEIYNQAALELHGEFARLN